MQRPFVSRVMLLAGHFDFTAQSARDASVSPLLPQSWLCRTRVPPWARGDETIPGLPRLDVFFGQGGDNPGPSVVQITTDTAGANRSLACLRRTLKIAHEDGKLPVLPIIRLHKELPARRGLVELLKFEELIRPDSLVSLRDLLLLTTAVATAVRLIEWWRVDLGRPLIRLENDQTNNDGDRYLPLPSGLVMMLAEAERRPTTQAARANLSQQLLCARYQPSQHGLGTNSASIWSTAKPAERTTELNSSSEYWRALAAVLLRRSKHNGCSARAA